MINIIELTHYIYPQSAANLRDHFNDYKKSLLSNKSWAKCIKFRPRFIE